MEDEPLTPQEIAYWAEFACWTVVVLWPFLYWVNGPAVSTDQLVVRTALVVLSLIGAITLRLTQDHAQSQQAQARHHTPGDRPPCCPTIKIVIQCDPGCAQGG